MDALVGFIFLILLTLHDGREKHTHHPKGPENFRRIFQKQTPTNRSSSCMLFLRFYTPKDHWTLKTGYFEDPTPAIQVQTLPLEGPRSLGLTLKTM